MTQITSENIANNTITTSQIATTAVASLQGPRITTITITDGSYSALDDSAVNTSGGYIKITGANFATGCSVVIGTTNATTVTFTSSTELRVAVPALTAGSYTVYVTNTDGGLAIKVNGLTYSIFPAWSTSSTLSAGYETTNVSVNLSATSDSSITYTVNAGSTLPSGLSLSSGGLLSGTLPAVASDTNYSFVIQATDAELQNTPRTFSLNDQADVINWTTPAANNTVYSGQVGVSFSQSYIANSLAGYSATITANSLPTGLSISGNVITGTPSVVANTATILTANAATSYKTGMRLIYINIAVAADPYFNLTTMATHASANASLANGTVISDASTNNFELTVAGTPRASNFTPFGTGWSNYVDGSNGYYTTVSGTAMNPYTQGTFTLECWINPTSLTTQYGTIISKGTTSNRDWALMTSATSGNNRDITWYYSPSFGDYFITSAANVLTTGVWQHVALVSTSLAIKIYVNGSQVISGTQSTTNSSNPTRVTIGSFVDYGTGTQPFIGYVSNIRYVSGQALYTGTFTPPTANLTTTSVGTSGANVAASLSGTVAFLTAQSNRFIENSSNNYSLTLSSAPTIQSFNPFNLTNTGSDGVMYFNGSTDHLSVPTATPLVLSGSVWTIECWCYLTSSDFSSYRILVNKRTSGSAASYDLFFNTTNGYLAFYNGTQYTSTVAPVAFVWNHVAAVYDGTNINLFMNGARVLQTATTNPDNGGSLWIGVEADASTNRFIGYISNVRILKGTALYSGTTYTVPTSALTAITNTSLLTLQNKYSHNTTQGHQDSSTNQLLITSAGSPAAGNFSPFSQSGWSVYFSANGNYITFPYTSANFDWWSSDYTLELWCYPLNLSSWSYDIGSGGGRPAPSAVGNMDYSGQTNYWSFGFDTSGYVKLYYYNGAQNAIVSTLTVNLNSWNHIAFTKTSSGVALFCNGVGQAAQAYSGTPRSTNSVLTIGQYDTQAVNGYISNLRILKGTALYSGTSYTVPTGPLTAVTNTKLLALQSNRHIDNSSNSLTATITGSPSVQAFAPFAPAAEYSQNTVGGSIYLNGSTDYLTTSLTTNLQFPADFTVECWVYMTSRAQSYPTIFSNYTNFDGGGGTFFLIAGHASYSTTLYQVGFNGVGNAIQSTTTIKYNTWQHVAVVRSGSTLTFYLNGVSEGTYTSSAAINGNGGSWWIGTSGNIPTSGGQLNGYISNFRVVKSTAVYTSTFTPPTSPVTSVANTTVLINGTSTALTDVSSRNNLVTTSLAKISSAQSKYGTASMYFGSGNLITIPSSNLHAFGTGDFTIEVWIYLTSVPTDTCIIDGRDGTVSAVKPCIFVQQSSSNFIFYVNGGIRIQGGTYSLNTWQHVAVCRSSGSTKMFVAGTQVGSTYTDANSYLTCALRIGYFNDGTTTNSFNGYMDDLRITRYARYTTNFTPMTETFQDK